MRNRDDRNNTTILGLIDIIDRRMGEIQFQLKRIADCMVNPPSPPKLYELNVTTTTPAGHESPTEEK